MGKSFALGTLTLHRYPCFPGFYKEAFLLSLELKLMIALFKRIDPVAGTPGRVSITASVTGKLTFATTTVMTVASGI